MVALKKGFKRTCLVDVENSCKDEMWFLFSFLQKEKNKKS